MTQTDFNTYKKFRQEGSITEKALPTTILKSHHFQGLLSATIIEKERSGRGFRFEVKRPVEFETFFSTHFPEDITVTDKTDNVRKFRNSKAKKIQSVPIFMLRGFKPLEVNDQILELKHYTEQFKLFACNAQSIKADKICIVENLDTFLIVENLLGPEYIYLHKYGRIGKDSLAVFSVEELLVFVDFDFNGLDEFLRIREALPQAQLYVPDNYEALFGKYSQSLSGNKAEMTTRIKDSGDKNVIMIRESILRNNRFLEQQYWKHD
ncbi:hypothetical protein [Flavobacterium psychrotrophum]|uniref:hypothetical protein n=1 Tax=Flavobacterium psychrotrophum TaxID=2294119 RepID=UPI000E3156DC|nr:hypothetical protein [Flavobacterium psychrotrophum]